MEGVVFTKRGYTFRAEGYTLSAEGVVLTKRRYTLRAEEVVYPFRFKKCVILRTFWAFSSTVYIMKF